MTATHSLTEAAARICGDSMKHPTLWVRKRIREGKFRATKVGRSVRMTDQQIEDAIAALEMGAAPEPPQRLGVTAASMRRRSA